MKYQYRLTENEETGGEEESGLKTIKGKNELILTALDGKTANDLMDVLQNPDNLKGTFVLRAEGLTDLEKRVFGDTKASNEANKAIYQENGMELYKKISSVVGGFKKGTPFAKKGKTGEIDFYFPEKNKYNLDLIKKYYESQSTGDEKSVRTSLNPVPVDDFSLKFQVSDENKLRKILNNAKLVPGKDYNLAKQKSKDIDLHEAIRQQLNKLYKLYK